MSAAHLYISVWFQIKFSEVETEELRFGEQCAVCFTKNIVASAPGLKCRDLVDKYFPLALDQVVFTAKLKSHIPSPPI